jgi:thiol-disulfide isomerase/thioredoxin
MRYLKSNLGFIFSLILLAIIAFNPNAKAFLLKGLIKTGLYQPGITTSKNDSDYPIAPATLFVASTGEKMDLSKMKDKVVFLNFWATWCPPCIAEMPSINSLRARYKDNDQVIFLMVDVDNNRTVAETFMKQNNYDLPVYTQASSIPESLFKGSVPTTIIISKKGEIVFNQEGMADYNSEKMQGFIDDLLK